MTAGVAFATGLTVGSVLGAIVGALFLAFWVGAFRRTHAEQAREDEEQMTALASWRAYEEHA